MKQLFSVFLFFCLVFSCLYAQEEQPEKNYRHYTSAIKIRPLAPLFGNYEIGYEKGGLKGGNKAIEGSIAYLGKPLLLASLSGVNSSYSLNGFRIKLGGKLYFGSQEFKIAGMKRTHPMYGKYFKVEVSTTARYFKPKAVNTTSYNYNYFDAQLLFIGGKQFVSDEFCFDIFGGIGYAYRHFGPKQNLPTDGIGFNYPIAGEVGFRIGYLFKDKPDDEVRK